jgi:hypothetical protein
MIFATEEYVPKVPLTTPMATMIELRIICVLVALFPIIFMKHKAGIIIA